MKIKCVLPESSCARIKEAFLLAKVTHVVHRSRPCKNCTPLAGTRTAKANIIGNFNDLNEGNFRLQFNSNIIFIDINDYKLFVV